MLLQADLRLSRPLGPGPRHMSWRPSKKENSARARLFPSDLAGGNRHPRQGITRRASRQSFFLTFCPACPLPRAGEGESGFFLGLHHGAGHGEEDFLVLIGHPGDEFMDGFLGLRLWRARAVEKVEGVTA